MKRTVYFPEIFAMVGEAKSKKEKIEILHKFRNEKGFQDILRQCYDPNIKWVVTRKEIENLTYDDMDIPDYDLAPSTLFLEARRRLYNYTSVRQPPLKKYKVIQLISGMFSSIHHEEVELFKQMVDGRIKEKGLTENLVREAFPNLLSTEEEVVSNSPKVSVVTEPEVVPPLEPEVVVEVVVDPAPKKKAGRPKGSTNKKKAGRPKGSTNKKVVKDAV